MNAEQRKQQQVHEAMKNPQIETKTIYSTIFSLFQPVENGTMTMFFLCYLLFSSMRKVIFLLPTLISQFLNRAKPR